MNKGFRITVYLFTALLGILLPLTTKPLWLSVTLGIILVFLSLLALDRTLEEDN